MTITEDKDKMFSFWLGYLKMATKGLTEMGYSKENCLEIFRTQVLKNEEDKKTTFQRLCPNCKGKLRHKKMGMNKWLCQNCNCVFGWRKKHLKWLEIKEAE